MRTYQREGMRARITHAYLSDLPSMSVVYTIASNCENSERQSIILSSVKKWERKSFPNQNLKLFRFLN